MPPRKIAPRIIAPKENYPLDSCPREKLTPANCPLTMKFPSKIVAPTQANSPQRVLQVNYGKLCIVYVYHNMQLLQLRSKKSFTSIYFLQILTKPCRTPIIREDILLNASWFSWARTQKRKNSFSKNWFGKKYKKYFIVNNNKKNNPRMVS